MIEQVVILLRDWMQYLEDRNDEILIQNQSPIPYDDNNKLDFSVKPACKIVSHRNALRLQTLQHTFHRCYTEGLDVVLVPPKSRQIIPTISNADDVSLLLICEVITYLMRRAANGETTSYKTIMMHLASDDGRCFELDGVKAEMVTM